MVCTVTIGPACTVTIGPAPAGCKTRNLGRSYNGRQDRQFYNLCRIALAAMRMHIARSSPPAHGLRRPWYNWTTVSPCQLLLQPADRISSVRRPWPGRPARYLIPRCSDGAHCNPTAIYYRRVASHLFCMTSATCWAAARKYVGLHVCDWPLLNAVHVAIWGCGLQTRFVCQSLSADW